MKTLLKVAQKVKANLFIVDGDYFYGQSLKSTLIEKLNDELSIKVFLNAESCLHQIMYSDEKPDIVILDHFENKKLNDQNNDHTVDYMQNMKPDVAIIILSDNDSFDRAIKALAYGANDFVIKDQFAHQHIYNAVKKCLHPAKV